MFNPKDLESVKAAFARGELTYDAILKNPDISFTWDEMKIADPVSLKFFGAFASAVANGSAPLRNNVDIPLSNGGVSSVKWSGEVTKVTFYNFNGAPRAAIYFDDKLVCVVSDIDFGSLRKLVYWLDRLLAKSVDIMFEHITGNMPK